MPNFPPPCSPPIMFVLLCYSRRLIILTFSTAHCDQYFNYDEIIAPLYSPFDGTDHQPPHPSLPLTDMDLAQAEEISLSHC